MLFRYGKADTFFVYSVPAFLLIGLPIRILCQIGIVVPCMLRDRPQVMFARIKGTVLTEELFLRIIANG